jgi:hypothetical protein
LLNIRIEYSRFKNACHKLLKERNKKVKATPIQVWIGREFSRSLRLQDLRKSAHEVNKIVSPTHRPIFHPGDRRGTFFSVRGGVDRAAVLGLERLCY